jgi:hypothetical protein
MTGTTARWSSWQSVGLDLTRPLPPLRLLRFNSAASEDEWPCLILSGHFSFVEYTVFAGMTWPMIDENRDLQGYHPQAMLASS